MTEDFTSAGQGYPWTGKPTMTDLERVREHLIYGRRWLAPEEPWADALADLAAHLKEDAVIERARKAERSERKQHERTIEQLQAELTQLREELARSKEHFHQHDQQYAELREAVRAILDTTDSRYSREDRLRQLIEEKP